MNYNLFSKCLIIVLDSWLEMTCYIYFGNGESESSSGYHLSYSLIADLQSINLSWRLHTASTPPVKPISEAPMLMCSCE